MASPLLPSSTSPGSIGSGLSVGSSSTVGSLGSGDSSTGGSLSSGSSTGGSLASGSSDGDGRASGSSGTGLPSFPDAALSISGSSDGSVVASGDGSGVGSGEGSAEGSGVGSLGTISTSSSAASMCFIILMLPSISSSVTPIAVALCSTVYCPGSAPTLCALSSSR